MITILNSFQSGCFDPIPGSADIHLFIFVFVVCLKSLTCSFSETTLATLTGTDTEQARLALRQSHLCVLHWVSLLQEHLTSFSKSSGASGVSMGSVVGIRVLDPSSSDHPIAGESGCSAFLQTST